MRLHLQQFVILFTLSFEPMSYLILHVVTVAPSITLDPMVANGIEVRSGLDFTIDAFITGKPKPKVTWTQGDSSLKNTTDGTVQIDTIRARSTLSKR